MSAGKIRDEDEKSALDKLKSATNIPLNFWNICIGYQHSISLNIT